MLLRCLPPAARKWVFLFSQRVTLPNMPPTLISGVRGVMRCYEALGWMGVFFARTGPIHDGDSIIAVVVMAMAIVAIVSSMHNHRSTPYGNEHA